MNRKSKTSISVYGAITAAIVLGSFIAVGIVQHVNAQAGSSQNATSLAGAAGKNVTSHNATSLAAGIGKGNNTSSGGGQGTK